MEAPAGFSPFENQGPFLQHIGPVFVREGDGERAVGQYPDATPAEALAYYERKYTELNGQVTLLEQRMASGVVSPDDARHAIRTLTRSVAEANAVGDLASLTARLEKVRGSQS